MAFAVTAFKSALVRNDGPSRSAGTFRVEVDITGAATDIDVDIGDLAAGTFWTAAEADSTYGATATALKALFTRIYPLASEVLLRSAVLESSYVRVVGATAAATQFISTPNATYAIQDLTFHAASAPTAYTLVFDFNLLAGSYVPTPEYYGTI